MVFDFLDFQTTKVAKNIEKNKVVNKF